MLNQVILEGRLGREPDIFMTQQGRQIAKFSLGTSTTWKDETGEWQTKVHWHEIVVHRDSTIRWIKVRSQARKSGPCGRPAVLSSLGRQPQSETAQGSSHCFRTLWKS